MLKSDVLTFCATQPVVNRDAVRPVTGITSGRAAMEDSSGQGRASCGAPICGSNRPSSALRKGDPGIYKVFHK
jgi:hypothetical protein